MTRPLAVVLLVPAAGLGWAVMIFLVWWTWHHPTEAALLALIGIMAWSLSRPTPSPAAPSFGSDAVAFPSNYGPPTESQEPRRSAFHE